MFDIGFTELLLIGIVALIVVGPEKLPSVIRMGMQYLRQFKSGVASIRDEVERELELDEVRKTFNDNKNQLGKAVGYDELHESLNELKQEANDLQNDWQDDEYVSDADIEADLAHLSNEMGPTLPKPDAEADTGIEDETKKTKRKKEVKSKKKNKARKKEEKKA